MGIMIFMLKSQRRAFRWPNNLCARLYVYTKLRWIYEDAFTKLFSSHGNTVKFMGHPE